MHSKVHQTVIDESPNETLIQAVDQSLHSLNISFHNNFQLEEIYISLLRNEEGIPRGLVDNYHNIIRDDRRENKVFRRIRRETVVRCEEEDEINILKRVYLRVVDKIRSKLLLFSSFRKWLKEFQGFAGRISKYLKEVSEMMKTVNSLDKMHEIIGSVFMENEVLEERIGEMIEDCPMEESEENNEVVDRDGDASDSENKLIEEKVARFGERIEGSCLSKKLRWKLTKLVCKGTQKKIENCGVKERRLSSEEIIGPESQNTIVKEQEMREKATNSVISSPKIYLSDCIVDEPTSKHELRSQSRMQTEIEGIDNILEYKNESFRNRASLSEAEPSFRLLSKYPLTNPILRKPCRRSSNKLVKVAKKEFNNIFLNFKNSSKLSCETIKKSSLTQESVLLTRENSTNNPINKPLVILSSKMIEVNSSKENRFMTFAGIDNKLSKSKERSIHFQLKSMINKSNQRRAQSTLNSYNKLSSEVIDEEPITRPQINHFTAIEVSQISQSQLSSSLAVPRSRISHRKLTHKQAAKVFSEEHKDYVTKYPLEKLEASMYSHSQHISELQQKKTTKEFRKRYAIFDRLRRVLIA